MNLTPTKLGEFREAQVLDLGEILDWLRGYWRMILGIALTVAALTAVYAFLAKVLYRADVVLSEVTKQPLSGTASQLSGLAEIAGINVGGGSSDVKGVAVLKSRALARAFIEKNSLEKPLYDSASDWIDGLFGSRKGLDIRDAVRIFDSEVRAVDEDRKTNLVTLSVTWGDPVEAARWANELVDITNVQLRDEAVATAERNIAYLRKEIAGTAVLPLQQSLSRTLELELQKLLMARGNAEFAFRVIDPAVPPKVKFKPRRKLIVMSGGVLGLIAGVMVALLVHVLRTRQPAPG